MLFLIRPGISAAAVNAAIKKREQKDKKNERARLNRLAKKQADAQAIQDAKPAHIVRAERINELQRERGLSYGAAVERTDREIKAAQNAAILRAAGVPAVENARV